MKFTPLFEQWKVIPGTRGYYAASNRGRIRRERGGTGARAGRVLKPDTNARGYLRVRYSVNGRRIVRLVHDVIAETWIGARPDGCVIHHKNGDKTDNRPGNLEYLSPKEHAATKDWKNRDHPGRVLTADDVREIRRLYATGAWTYARLGRRFGITKEGIGKVVRRETWRDV